MEFTGRKVSVGIGREAVRGTAETTVDYWLNHMSIGFYPRAEKALNESALGNLHKQNDSATMTKWAEGDFEMKAGVQSLPALLNAAMGTLITTDNADSDASVKDHTITFDQSNSPASYTFFKKDPNHTLAYALGMFSTLELSAELGGWLMVTGTVIAKPGVTSAVTVTRINETEFKPKHIAVRLAANTAGLGAATDIATLQSFKLTIDRSVDRDLALGTDEPYDISVREIEVGGELVLRYADQTMRDAFLNDTQQAMRISMINTDVTIGAAARPSVVVTIPKVTFEDWSPDEGLADKVNQTIAYKVLYDFDTANAMTVVVTNTVASYA